jgi:phosphate transport system permease protein
MSGATETSVQQDGSELFPAVGAGSVGLAFLGFVLSLAVLFPLLDPAMSLGGGLLLYDVLGLLMLAAGVALIATGVASRQGYAATTPNATAGLTTGVVLGLLGFVVTGLFVSQTLGVNGPLGLGWLLGAFVGGGVVFVATVVPREDIGSTLPVGVFAMLTGSVVLFDVVSDGWSWNPSGLQATFGADIAVPVMVIVASLLVAWSGAKAYEGFGAEGRQLGAYMFVNLNAALMMTVLFVLIAFIVYRGLPGVLQGAELGLGTGPQLLFGLHLPFDIPFVMNSYGLRNDVNGVLPAIFGTIWLVVGAVILAVPTGVGAAVFLTEYSEQGRFTQVVEIATNGLWSTPSIVYGLFGLAFLVPRFGNSASILSGQLVLGFMLLPLVVITTREAIMAVPDAYRDASAALGVNQWQTIRSVVLPAALPGTVTGIILGVGRIAGETAPILLVTSSSMSPFPASRFVPRVLSGFQFTASPPFVTNPELLQASSALPYQLYALITAGVGAGAGGNADIDPWSTALVLMVVVLSFYAVGIASRNYFRRRLHQ